MTAPVSDGSGDEGLELDPEADAAARDRAVAEIPADASVGRVYLSVSDLARSVEFYERAVGLAVRQHAADSVTLGSDTDLLVLLERPGARPALGYSGLFHFALLLPERPELAAWLAHAARDGVPLTGLSDHFVSEAIYLDDPDGHGIEIYWDRPRALWEGRVAERMTTLPLDTRDLMSELEDPRTARFSSLPAGTVMGHVHLCVAHVPETVEFYRDTLGFALMAQLGPQAAFFGAGGYHHHLGANTWQSRGAPYAPEGTARLELATIVLPDQGALDRVVNQSAAGDARLHDPSGTPLELRTRG
jgi:catechol 2,3-dioxygenase